MNEQDVLDIYDTLRGEIIDGFEYPGVRNMFLPGSSCDEAYNEMRAAYERICGRLGVDGEYRDLEIIVSAMELIQRELCFEMFDLGKRFWCQLVEQHPASLGENEAQ